MMTYTKKKLQGTVTENSLPKVFLYICDLTIFFLNSAVDWVVAD